MCLSYACVNLDSLYCDLGGTGPKCPSTPFVPKTCAELSASAFHWSLSGFTAQDILNPDDRSQRELTAIMHVNEVRTLNVSAGSTQTSEDCSSKAVSSEWFSSSPNVVRLTVSQNQRSSLVTARKPGDSSVAAVLQFEDGTPPMRVLPWSFTNVGSGDITIIRVLP